MPKLRTFEIHALGDDDAAVWVADSHDIPGLIPELLEANGLLHEYEQREIPFHLLSERTELVKCGVCSMADYASFIKKLLREHGCHCERQGE